MCVSMIWCVWVAGVVVLRMVCFVGGMMQDLAVEVGDEEAMAATVKEAWGL